MEKIIITCNADYLSYEFPKRKWYQWLWGSRAALIWLNCRQNDILEADILLCIYENRRGLLETQEDHEKYLAKTGRDGFNCFVHPLYKKEVCRGMVYQYRTRHESMEHVVILDFGEELLPELLYEMAQNRNYLSIFTQTPEAYENVLARIEMDFGLVGMMFAQSKEFIRYLKQLPKELPALVMAGGGENIEGKNEMRLQKERSSLLYQLPKNSFILDLHLNEFFCSHILKKRMNFTYASIPIFLDNTVKNRYNAVVNEGITFQVINEKTFWRRKGNKDGRKEEYSDL